MKIAHDLRLRVGVERLAGDACVWLLGAGEKKQALHHARQAIQFFEAGGEHVAVSLRCACLGECDLGLAAQIEERRAQFVGEVGGKLREPREGFVEPREHRVESGGERAQFVGPTGGC